MTLRVQSPPADSLRAVLRRVFAGSEYDWEARADPFAFLSQLQDRVQAWLLQLRDAHPVVYGILIATLALLLVAILAHLAYVAWRALHPEARAPADPIMARGTTRDARWHLEESSRLVEAGRYTDALAHRFVALLLELDERSVVSFHPSKTPAEYLSEAHLTAADRGTLTQLVATLYRHLFGGEPCNRVSVTHFDREAAAFRRIDAAR